MTCTPTASSRWVPATTLTSDLCFLPSPSHLSHQLPSPPSFCGECGLSRQKGHIWVYLPFDSPLRPVGQDGSAPQSCFPHPLDEPMGREDLRPPQPSQVSSIAVVLISLSPQGTAYTGDHMRLAHGSTVSAHRHMSMPSPTVACVAPSHVWEHRGAHRAGLCIHDPEHMADPCVNADYVTSL